VNKKEEMLKAKKLEKERKLKEYREESILFKSVRII